MRFVVTTPAAMKLSLFSDYALRVLMFAALKADDFRVDEVTAAYGISRNHVAKIIHRLAQLGYLETRRGRGAQGGGPRRAELRGTGRGGPVAQPEQADHPAAGEHLSRAIP